MLDRLKKWLANPGGEDRYEFNEELIRSLQYHSPVLDLEHGMIKLQRGQTEYRLELEWAIKHDVVRKIGGNR